MLSSTYENALTKYPASSTIQRKKYDPTTKRFYQKLRILSSRTKISGLACTDSICTNRPRMIFSTLASAPSSGELMSSPIGRRFKKFSTYRIVGLIRKRTLHFIQTQCLPKSFSTTLAKVCTRSNVVRKLSMACTTNDS